MPLFNGVETARELETEISHWCMYTSSFNIGFFFFVCCSLITISWLPKFRYTKIGAMLVTLSGACWCLLVMIIILIAFVFLQQNPIPNSSCYLDFGDAISLLDKSSSIAISYWLLWVSQIITLGILGLCLIVLLTTDK